MTSRGERNLTTSNIPEERRVIPENTRLTHNRTLINELKTQKVSQDRRKRISETIIRNCLQDATVLLETIDIFDYFLGLNPDAQKVFSDLVEDEKIIELVFERRILPSANTIYLLSIFIVERKSEDKQTNQRKKKINLLEAFLQVPSIISSKTKVKEGRKDTTQIVDAALVIIDNLTRSYVAHTQQSGLEHAVAYAKALVQAWSTEATRLSQNQDGNLFQYIYLQSLDGDSLDRSITAGAAVIYWERLERAFLKETEGILKTRKMLAEANLVTHLPRNRQSLDPFATYTNGLIEKLDQLSVQVRVDASQTLKIDVPGDAPFVYRAAMEDFLTVQYKNRKFEFYEMFLPQGDRITVVHKVGSSARRVVKPILREHLAQNLKSEIITIDDPELAIQFLELVVPNISEEILEKSLNEERVRAQGGLAGIGRRGNSIVLKPERSESDRYLHTLGIKSLKVMRGEKIFKCLLAWDNFEFIFRIDFTYKLMGHPDIHPTIRMWIEHLLLSYIADIKQDQQDRKESLRERRNQAESGDHAFAGSKPNLRYLHPGQNSRKIEGHPSLEIDEDEIQRYEIAAIEDFGCSLSTINEVFRRIQLDPHLLENERVGELHTLISDWDNRLPEWRRMTTNAETVAAIVKKIVKRILQEGLDIQQFNIDTNVQVFFSITSVVEGKMKDDSTVGEPVRVWLPNAADKITSLDELAVLARTREPRENI